MSDNEKIQEPIAPLVPEQAASPAPPPLAKETPKPNVPPAPGKSDKPGGKKPGSRGQGDSSRRRMRDPIAPLDEAAFSVPNASRTWTRKSKGSWRRRSRA